MSRDVVIVGFGNLLRQDDGLGVHLIQELAERLPAGVRVVEGGTSPLDAIWESDQAERLVLVDAVQGGGPPGTIYRIPVDDLIMPSIPAELGAEMALPSSLHPEPGACQAVDGVLSLHDLDLVAALKLSRLAGCRLDRAVLIGMEPAAIDWGTELSPEVQACLPKLVNTVLAETIREEARTC